MTPTSTRQRSLSNRELLQAPPATAADAFMRMLSDVVDRGGAAPTLKDAAEDALGPIIDVLGMDYASFMAVQDGVARFLVGSGQVASVFRAATEETEFQHRDGVVGRAMLSTEVCSAEGDELFGGPRGAAARRAGVVQEVGIPVLDNSGVIGVISVISTRARPLSEAGFFALRTLGRLLGDTLAKHEFRAASERVESELARFTSTLDSAPTNIMLADRDGTVQYLNKASIRTLRSIEEYLPVSVDDIVGNSFDVFHKNPTHQRRMVADPSNLPHRSVIQVGPEKLDLLVSPTYDARGEYIGPMATWDIVTEKLRIEREMARISNMMENAPINVIFADRELNIQYANPATVKTLKTMERLINVNADELVGQSIDIFHKHPEHQRRILKDPNNLPHSAKIALGDETLDLLVSPIFDTKGDYLGPMLTWKVITDQVRAEKAIKEASDREAAEGEALRAKVNSILDVVSSAGAGDLTRDVEVCGEDAIGQLGEGLQAFFSNLRKSIGEIAENATTLGAASEEMSATSGQMTSPPSSMRAAMATTRRSSLPSSPR